MFIIASEDIENIRNQELKFIQAVRLDPSEQNMTKEYLDYHQFMMQNYLGNHYHDDDTVDYMPAFRSIVTHYWANAVNMPLQCQVHLGRVDEAIETVCKTSNIFRAIKQLQMNEGTSVNNTLSKVIELFNDRNNIVIVNREIIESYNSVDFALGPERSLDLFIIISELISNAIKYSPENSKIEVEFTTAIETRKIPRSEEEYSYPSYFLTVRDEGIGVPQEEQELVIKPGYRAKNVKDYNGDGFGLSFIYLVCHKNISIKSPLYPDEPIHKGTEIKVRLPI